MVLEIENMIILDTLSEMAFYCSINFYFYMDIFQNIDFQKVISIRALFLWVLGGKKCFLFWEHPTSTKPLALFDFLEVCYEEQ